MTAVQTADVATGLVLATTQPERALETYRALRLADQAYIQRISREALAMTDEECAEIEEDRRDKASQWADWRASA